MATLLINLDRRNNMHLSDDKRRVRISIARTLNATEMDSLIQQLADLRAQMQQPVPANLELHAGLVTEPDPPFVVTELELTDAPGVPLLLLALRHPGLGWCNFDLDLPTAALLRDLIAQRTVGVRGAALDADRCDKPGH